MAPLKSILKIFQPERTISFVTPSRFKLVAEAALAAVAAADSVAAASDHHCHHLLQRLRSSSHPKDENLARPITENH